MTNSKTTRKALLSSALALTLCVAMLIATTFAWFTDTASTAVNKIQAGTLDVELYYADNTTGGEGTTWTKITRETSAFEFVKATSHENETVLWEPGCTYSLPALKIKNEGNLALKYKVLFSATDTDAENLELAKVLDVTMNGQSAGTLYDVLTSTDEDGYAHGTLEGDKETDPITLSVKMRETVGNEYQGLSIGGIAITVVATQDTVEYDSYNNQYDKDAVLPVSAIAKGNLTVEQNTTGANATVKEEQTLSDSVMSVTYPANVVLDTTSVSEGTNGKKKSTVEQKLKYVDDKASDAMNRVTIDADKAVASYDLTLPVANTNTTLVKVTINYAKGLTGVQIYHDGALLTSTANGNGETATYDSDTGVITLNLKHASPIDIVYNKPSAVAVVKNQSELDTALANTDISTIVLGANWSGDIAVSSSRAVTLDFDGYTVNGTMWVGREKYDMSSYNDGGVPTTLTLMDSKSTGGIATTNKTVINLLNSSTLTIDSGNYVNSGTESYSNVIYTKGKSVTVNGGYLHNNSSSSYGRVIYVDKEEATTVTINGGKIKGSETADRSCLISSGPDSNGVRHSLDVVINGGEFIVHTTYSRMANVYGTVTVNDCTFKLTNTSKDHVNVFTSTKSNDGTYTPYVITVKGGTFTVSGWPTGGFEDMSPYSSGIDGTLSIDPAKDKTVKINKNTLEKYIAEGAAQTGPDDSGYYTIAKN